MAVTIFGLTIGDDGTGWQWPTYALIREAMSVRIRKLRGKANLQTQPGSFFGNIIDLVVTPVDIAGQNSRLAVDRTIFTAMQGVALDQFLADYLTRVVATASTATVYVYGTPGAIAGASTPVRTSAVATPFLITVAAVVPAAPSEAYAIEVLEFAAGAYAGQLFRITVPAGDADYVANGLDDSESVRDGLSLAVTALVGSVDGYDAGVNPSNNKPTLIVADLSGGGPFACSVTGPAGALTLYPAIAAPATTGTILGPTYAPLGSLRVGSAIAGIQGYTNIADAVPGRVRETDSQFRARHQIAQRGLGGGSPDAIRAVILADPAAGGGGARFCGVEYNPTGANPDAFGNKDHSVRIIVDQFADAFTVATALFRAKAAGDNTNGPELVVIQDFVGDDQDIYIDRLSDLWIAADIEVVKATDWPTTGDPLTQIRQDVTDFIEGLQPRNIGVRVADLPIALFPTGLPRGIESFRVRLGQSVTQGGPYAYLDYYPSPEPDAILASIDMTSRQKARAQIADITAILV